MGRAVNAFGSGRDVLRETLDEHPLPHPLGGQSTDQREHQKDELHRSQEDEQPDHVPMMPRISRNGTDHKVTTNPLMTASSTVISA